MEYKVNYELIEIINKQNNLIAELLNENIEKENLINVLMRESGNACQKVGYDCNSSNYGSCWLFDSNNIK